MIDPAGLSNTNTLPNSSFLCTFSSLERSLNAIRRMNALHSKYKAITNQDFLYVLAIFICEPMRLAELYGYR